MSGGALSGVCSCFRPPTSHLWIGGIIGAATIEAFDLTTTPESTPRDPELELLLEAARRATWDALHGPRYLRSGRFHPNSDDLSELETAKGIGQVPGDRGEKLDRGC
jgi:hypothetical protein